MLDNKVNNNLIIAVLPIAIALNVALGSFVSVVKLPIFLDSIGTIMVTLMFGWRLGVLVGVLSFGLMSIILNPVYIYFVGTQAVIAMWVYWLATRLHAFRNVWTTMLSGLSLGVIAALVSAPVIVYVFGGVAGSGRDLITAVLMNSGTQVIKAVALSGAASEPIDKGIQLIVACLLVKNAPKIILDKIDSKALRHNKFLRNSN